jgi:hypothetical protein
MPIIVDAYHAYRCLSSSMHRHLLRRLAAHTRAHSLSPSQTTPNDAESVWLWLLGVDYTINDLVAYVPVNVTVTVAGDPSVPELCPASSFFGSQSSCQYLIQVRTMCLWRVRCFRSSPAVRGSWLTASPGKLCSTRASVCGCVYCVDTELEQSFAQRHRDDCSLIIRSDDALRHPQLGQLLVAPSAFHTLTDRHTFPRTPQGPTYTPDYYDFCCPTGVTAYSSDARLKGQAGYPNPQVSSSRH